MKKSPCQLEDHASSLDDQQDKGTNNPEDMEDPSHTAKEPDLPDTLAMTVFTFFSSP